jgi:hypothetical protein
MNAYPIFGNGQVFDNDLDDDIPPVLVNNLDNIPPL